MSASFKNDGAHQERVNVEMFRAIETLGRKLERVEDERDRLARRLALIESAATVDEKTGKLYLPVVVDSALPPQTAGTAAPRWMVATSLMSSALALLAVGIVMFRPAAPALTPSQMAALTMLTQPQLTRLDDRDWTRVTPEDEIEPAAGGLALPDDALLAQEERLAAQVESVAIPEEMPAEEIAAAATAATSAEGAAEGPVETPAPSLAEAEIIPSVEMPVALAPVPAEEAPAETAPAPSEKQKKIAKKQPVAAEPVVAEPMQTPAPTVVAAAPQVLAKAVTETETEVAAAAAVSAPSPVHTVSVIPPDGDLPENIAQLEKRAFDGVPEAQHDLATLYASGKVVAQDYKRAVYWFNRAAEGGIANADYNMGVMFQQGLGVRKDLKKAVARYERAAELGHPEAMYNLGIAHVEGIGTERNIERGVAHFKRAANAGVAQAAYNLGVLYESSFIGPIDKDKALEWYAVAADSGHADAESAMHRLQSQLAAADDGQDQALTLADMVEPAAGESGEGDASDAGDSVSGLVAAIQEQLSRLGYLPAGGQSGAVDPKTEDAIRAFQKKSGLAVDGTPSRELLTKLSAAQ